MNCQCYTNYTCSLHAEAEAREEQQQAKERVELRRRVRQAEALAEQLLDEVEKYRRSTKIGKDRYQLLERIATRAYYQDDRAGILDMVTLRELAARSFDVIPGENQ